MKCARRKRGCAGAGVSAYGAQRARGFSTAFAQSAHARKVGEQDALRLKLQKKKLGSAEARPARFVVRRRHAEAFEPHRGAMRFLADRMRSARSPPSLSLNRADLPRRTSPEVRLALACRSRSTRRRSTNFALDLRLYLAEQRLSSSRTPSHRVQTASPELSGLVHRRLPIGDGRSIARVRRCRIDFGAGVGIAGFSRRMWGIERKR